MAAERQKSCGGRPFRKLVTSLRDSVLWGSGAMHFRCLSAKRVFYCIYVLFLKYFASVFVFFLVFFVGMHDFKRDKM